MHTAVDAPTRRGPGAGLPGSAPDQVDVAALARALTEAVDGEVRFDAGTRATYSTDSSNYRQVPIGVVLPRTVDAAVDAIAVCRRFGAPLVSRGGGTSLAGQCTNTAVVIDWSKYCNRLISVDAEARTCVVEPGIVLDVLNEALKPYRLGYGPKPSTHPNCTLGGMIGNNSCGATAQRTGKVVDNIARLEVLTYDGVRFWCGETSDEEYVRIERRADPKAAIYRGLRHLREEYADDIRAGFPDIPRRVSGYNLDSLLPEHGFDLAGLLVGSESTLVTVLRAELELVPLIPHRSLVVVGYESVIDAAAAVPDIVRHEPIALEAVDHRLVRDQRINHLNPDALADLPRGQAFLMVQFGGDSAEEARQRARDLIGGIGRDEDDDDVTILSRPETEDELWRAREAGLGATARVPGEPDTWEGWEDSAVHPDDLADYLRDLERLYEEFGYADTAQPSMYGHFGQGCVHTRIPFRLTEPDGVAEYRRFLERAAQVVASYHGSLSGEHGDGQSRGELLPTMFGPRVMEAFGRLKAIFDPQDRMNPGKVVAPRPLDHDLRLGAHWSPHYDGNAAFAYTEDEGSFVRAATRCVGVGRCRQHSHDGNEVMCPSYQATHEEEHSTRGRSRLLFEMLDGHHDSPVDDGWRSTEVRDALDLCLACKGCKSDCPVEVDMATYKAEFLFHHYAGRLRPRAHYALGWLPLVGSLVGRARLGPAVNALSHAPVLPHLATRAAGLEDREIPLFAGETLQQWWQRRGGSRPGPRGEVMLWPDTFTNTFHPHIGRAAVAVLEDAGWSVRLPSEPVCCGLTWISTGQLGIAKRILARTARQLADHVASGGLVVGLEPSCTAVFRSDAPELLPENLDVKRLKERTVTLAELLVDHTPGWQPPDLEGVEAMVQVHCHQHAVLKWDADHQLLADAHAEASRLESGCCGLAGNFGFEKGHAEVSEACAESVLLPAVRDASPDTVILADGFSCRTQVHELSGVGREAIHLAELLERGLPATARAGDSPAAARPSSPSRTATTVALAGAGLSLVAGAGLAALGLRRAARALRRGRRS